MYNLRYHIVSLVAVFLALAMGLLLGTIVVERGVLSSQQTQLIEGLQKDFDQIRSESAAVKKANTDLTRFATDAMPRLVESALTSRTVLIIASPDNGDTASTVAREVRAAGGIVAVATFSEPDFALASPAVAKAASVVLAVPEGSVTTTMIVSALAREWSTRGDARLLTKALVDANALKFTGLASTEAVAGTVVTCSFDGKPDAAVLLLAKSLSDVLRSSVGVETTTRSDGTAQAASKSGLSAVDNVDSPLGQISLTWVLAGRANGYFGRGAKADAAFPTPLFAE